MKIIFIRHGESEANVHQIISNTGYIHGLTDKGKSQAISIAGKLKREYSDSLKIFSSPLKRADETSRIISSHLNTDYITDNRLIEFHTGILEGRSDEKSWNQLYDLGKLWLSGKDHAVAIPGGESLDDVVVRLKDFLNSIIENHLEHEVILCVSHGGVMQTAIPIVIPDEKAGKLRTYDLQNTDVVEIEFSAENGLLCKKYGPI